MLSMHHNHGYRLESDARVKKNERNNSVKSKTEVARGQLSDALPPTINDLPLAIINHRL